MCENVECALLPVPVVLLLTISQQKIGCPLSQVPWSIVMLFAHLAVPAHCDIPKGRDPYHISVPAASSAGLYAVNESGKAQAGRQVGADVASSPTTRPEQQRTVNFMRRVSLSKANRSRGCREVSLGSREDLPEHNSFLCLYWAQCPKHCIISS